MKTKIPLAYPIKYADRIIEEVELRRPKGRDMRKLSGVPSMDDLLNLGAKLAGEPVGVFDEMDGSDVVKVTEVVAGFLDPSLETGPSA